MKIWVLSDLHLEVAPLDPPLEVPTADVCVVAGDLCRGVAKGVAFLADLLKGRMPGLYVAGNHEYWKTSIEQEIEQGRQASHETPNVHFLEDEAVVLDGVTFIGATLWTDFQLHGAPKLAMSQALDRMNDYRRIALRKEPWKRFLPHDGARIHARSKAYIDARLADSAGPSVVVTHHAPHPLSLALELQDSPIEPAYASNFEGLMLSRRPNLWIHGHTHLRKDYGVGSTRVVSNPCGYPEERHGFDRGCIVEV